MVYLKYLLPKIFIDGTTQIKQKGLIRLLVADMALKFLERDILEDLSVVLSSGEEGECLQIEDFQKHQNQKNSPF